MKEKARPNKVVTRLDFYFLYSGLGKPPGQLEKLNLEQLLKGSGGSQGIKEKTQKCK